MPYHFKNLVFEGGGVKGVAYVGATKVLEDKGILGNIERVGGTSAGAINAVLLALNYSNEEAEKILSELNFKKFMDSSWWMVDVCRVWKEYGWNKGKFFRNWIGERIAKKTGSSETTFAELYKQKEQGRNEKFKDLYILGTNLSTRFSEVFSYEKTPNMPIADAVRISMSIPLFFASERRGERKDVYVDGGLLANFPVKIFDREKYVRDHKREPDYYKKHNESLGNKGINISKYVYNKETLGFRLDSKEEIGIFRDQKEPMHHKINSFVGFAKGLIWTMMNHQLNIHLHDDDWQRTIYIDASIASVTEFDLSEDKKSKLIEEGQKGVKKYFDWYDNQPSVNK
ncbi:MAG: patatin-like phospholipase family protein [Candidatus Omnitrophica bacterium]|nr:patatin-like phospholipase family protein [Candidatus Omnitrophota bacterium]